jgi:hypothetical protein
MFIRSSTAINDCLIALDTIAFIEIKDIEIRIYYKEHTNYEYAIWRYESQEARDKAFEELCAFLNSNYKLRDFT